MTERDARGAAAGLQIPARIIPAPTSISAEAQALLAAPSPYGGDQVEPAPDDVDGWRRHVRAGNEKMTQMLAYAYSLNPPASLVEHKLSHAALYEIEPHNLSASEADKVLYYVHGGGFTVGGGIAAAYAANMMAPLSGLRTYAIDYRMPPDHPFPAGLDDAVEGYELLLEKYGASNIAVYGPSAGGGLAASLLLKARDLGMAMPAACVLHSPECDLTESGDSFETNLGIDSVLKRLTNSIALYANGHDLRDPYLSPLFGDFTKGFPPTLLSTGTRDLFLSNTVLMHRALRRAGVAATLSVWEAMGHGGFYGMAPEDREVLNEHVDFLLRHLRRS